ncbi:hypothetical protein DPEC_G00211100 [Dallia pectoralis]|uniref:Uncharacterized protein n=1 Tax=Dallia pectoralis TaxID=75939 RepID=A0ACC2G5K9_DALPE|nr:hypothetical protein DPEC_G00211100 [Dallia pectoralis]
MEKGILFEPKAPINKTCPISWAITENKGGWNHLKGIWSTFFPTYLEWPVTQNKFSWNAFLSIFRSLFSRIRSIMSRDPPDSPRSSQNKKPNHRSTTKNKFGWSTWLSILRSFFKCFSLSNDTPGSTQLPQHEKESSTITTSVLPVEKTDKYFCEYDSTWEDQSEEPVRRSPQSYRFNRFRCAARDMQKYRHDYPERTVSYYSSGQDEMPNLQFYLGQRTSSPDGVSIEDFHNEWRGDYSKLERVHSYIQWLFPLQEPGMNYQATELTKKEIQAFLSNNTARERLLESYKLMLDFYGIKLTNDTTGDVETAENWHQRFENLDRHSHNNLRITRILKCLGTLGFPHFQAPLVKFFLKQTLVEGRLDSVKESALNYFIFAVLDKQERRELVNIMLNGPPGNPPSIKNELENSSVAVCIDDKEGTSDNAIQEVIISLPENNGGMNTSHGPVEIVTVPSLVENDDEEEETDYYFCEYDSTWEESSEETDPTWEESSEETLDKRRSRHERIHTIYRSESYRFNRFRSAARDMQKYRHDYPERTVSYYSSGQDEMPNLQFYLGQRTSSPDGVSIEDFHNEWRGDYSKLERVHSYIQWLFPLQEPGMNYQATELTKKEIQAFLSNNTARERLLESYKLMLDFYGIKLTNDTTGDVETAENWHQRFENLDRHSHNNLRITRILKCLGTLGFPHFQAPLVKFFLKQTLVEGRLDSVKESALNYFIFAVLDKQERRELVKYAYQHYEPEHEFVWCPMTIQNMFMEEEYSGDENTAVLTQFSTHETERGGLENTSNDSAYSSCLAPGSDQRKRSAVEREGPPVKFRRGSGEDSPSEQEEQLGRYTEATGGTSQEKEFNWMIK